MAKRTYLALALAAVFTLPALAQDEDTIYWLDSYQEALRQSKETGKPIFLEYRCEP